jgi:hypothetical protein
MSDAWPKHRWTMASTSRPVGHGHSDEWRREYLGKKWVEPTGHMFPTELIKRSQAAFDSAMAAEDRRLEYLCAKLPERPSALVRQGGDWYAMTGTGAVRLTGGPTPATVQHKCARCEQALDVPVIGDVHGRLDEALAAHQERCFRVGDWVRIEMNRDWLEGEVTSTGDHEGHHVCRPVVMSKGLTAYRGHYGDFTFRPAPGIRRIPRPEQKGEVSWEEAAKIADIAVALEKQQTRRIEYLASPVPRSPTIETPWMKVDDERSPIGLIEASKYDGLTGKECLERYELLQRDDVTADTFAWSGYRLTAIQLAAARELWSLQLKAKIQDSKEAERRRVVVDLQDDEENPW